MTVFSVIVLYYRRQGAAQMAYFVLKKCSVLCGIAPFQPVLRNRSKKTALRCLHDSKALKVSFILLAFSVNTFFYGHPSRKKLCCFFSFLFFCMTKCCYRKLNAGDKKAGRPTRPWTKDSAARGLRLLARISAGNHRERAVSEVVWGLPRREGRACVISHTHTPSTVREGWKTPDTDSSWIK